MSVFKKIAPDKWKHFFVGIAMGALLQVLSLWLLPTTSINTIFISSAIVIAISYGFELFSKITGIGRYDFMDAVASIGGGALGILLVLLFVK